MGRNRVADRERILAKRKKLNDNSEEINYPFDERSKTMKEKTLKVTSSFASEIKNNKEIREAKMRLKTRKISHF